MNPLVIGAVLVGLVAVATVIGVVVRVREGRVHEVHRFRKVTPQELGLETRFGSFATIVQFSSEFCTKCPATHELLAKAADDTRGIKHVDIDITHRPDIANSFNILQTPTTLVLDETGAIAARIGGAPRPDAITSALDIALRRDHDLYFI